MEGSASRAEPSAQRPEIADGSILQDRTFHENAAHHGRFNVQSGTLHAEARNRGRFHFPDPFPRPEPSTKMPRIMEGSASRAEPSAQRPETVEGSISQTHFPDPSPRPEPLRCMIPSRQFNMPVGMELTTSSARQDTAPLSRILPDKKPATPATFVTSAPAGAMDNPVLPGHYPALPKAMQMNIQLAASGPWA